MKVLFATACIAMLITSQTVNGQDLLLDFNSLTQDGGPHPQEGYQSYDAGHEVADDFVTKSYAAFGASVDFTPSWPDTTDNRVQQMIDRGAGNDANYLGQKLDLVTDFIGIRAAESSLLNLCIRVPPLEARWHIVPSRIDTGIDVMRRGFPHTQTAFRRRLAGRPEDH